jgi:CO/xanthine dehydrogenase FAD-binding subunit
MIAEKTYYRPATLKEALALLERRELRATPLAGGSHLVPLLRADVDLPGSLAAEVDGVVDLADLGLAFVRPEGGAGNGWLHLGAMTRLAEIVDEDVCGAIAGGLLTEAARREGPVNLRNVATIAGSVLTAEPASELLLALLALTAEATLVSGDGAERTVPLAALSAEPQAVPERGLITALRLPWPGEAVRGGLARVARTPADHPIVAAAAVVDGSSARVAIGGVTQSPVLVHLDTSDDVAQAILSAVSGHALLFDFRGSAEYRQAMAPILARRAIEQAHS